MVTVQNPLAFTRSNAIPAVKNPVGRRRGVLPLFAAGLVTPDKKIPDAAYQLIEALPKTELHVHQSGSSDIEFLRKKLIEQIMAGKITTFERVDPVTKERQAIQIDLNTMTASQLNELLSIENVRQFYRVAVQAERKKYFAPSSEIAEDGGLALNMEATRNRFREESLGLYRETSRKINPLVKNLKAARELAKLFANTVVQENVRYAEYRISPSGYEGVTPEQLVRAVNRGFQDALQDFRDSKTPFGYGLILLFERQGQDKVKKAELLAQQAVRLRKKGYPIVGVDLAGDELNNPVTEFASAFNIIRDYNDSPKTPPSKRIGITIHAGETPKSGTLTGWESMREAIKVAYSPNTPVRIGHGVHLVYSSPELKAAFERFRQNPAILDDPAERQRMIQSSPLLQEVLAKHVTLEMCPKSNVQTLAVDYHNNHPAVFLSRLGVRVTLSTDNRTISNTDTTNEFVKLYKYAGATFEDIKRMIEAGFEAAFVFDPKKKKTLIQHAARDMAAIEANPAHQQGIRILNRIA